MGLHYLSVAKQFLLHHLDLWSSDGVHLSDAVGMRVLVQSLWVASFFQVPEPQPVLRRKVPPPVPQFSPRVEVKEEVAAPRHSNLDEWIVVGSRRKTSRPDDIEFGVATKKRRAQQKGDMVLKECSIILNPVWFSRELLEALGDGTVHVLAPVSTAGPKGLKEEATASLEPPGSSSDSLATVAVKDEVCVPSDQPLEDPRKETSVVSCRPSYASVTARRPLVYLRKEPMSSVESSRTSHAGVDEWPPGSPVTQMRQQWNLSSLLLWLLLLLSNWTIEEKTVSQHQFIVLPVHSCDDNL
ncbi:hypothetical protein UPYG_G00205700 [Umbra pygmaea]|uniref:BRCT domain-containing protein n=1 Tax=Umbra pygmaea TaxID=75934 RepID=A0ABD0X9L0_UMBPY